METTPNRSKPSWLEFVILIVPFIYLAVQWSHFPARIPIHWNIHGTIDGWASKPFGLLMLPVCNLLVYALFFVLPRIDPKIRRSPEKYERTIAVMRVIRIAMLLFFLGLFAMQAAAAQGIPVSMNRCVFNGCLILFMVIGNYLSGLRPNYFAGIRTPWTLENPDTWRATHRIGGRIMFYGALFLIAAQFFAGLSLWTAFFIIFIFGFAGWAVIYSWNHARTHPQAH